MNEISPTDAASPLFLGLRMARLSLDQAVDHVMAGAAGGTYSYVVTPNVDHVVQLHQSRSDSRVASFAEAYTAAGLVLCDSRILQRLARLSGLALPVVPGSDLTRAMIEDPRTSGRTVAIIGGSSTLVPALERLVPGIVFTQLRPPMNVLADHAAMMDIERFVADRQADIVLFVMGAPQSEIAAHRCLQGGRARGIGLCVGASLDFIIGEKRRAPHWMQRIGLEWAFRLGSEPRRLWRRYLVEGPRIFAIWLREKG